MKTDLENAQTTLRVKPGNALDVARLRQVVVKAGFTPTWIRFEAVGQVLPRGGSWGFRVSGVDQMIPLVENAELRRLRQEAEGKTVAITALIPEKQEGAQIETFQVR